MVGGGFEVVICSRFAKQRRELSSVPGCWWTIATMGPEPGGFREERRNLVWTVLSAASRWARNQGRHRRQRPPADLAGVREPRRPKPTLPAAAIALAEPRTEVRRRFRLVNLRDIHR
jgi:hypothetical protein